MNGSSVAVVGATGQVGRIIRTFLAERDFPAETIRLFSSSCSSDAALGQRNQYITVEDVTTSDSSGIDITVFSVGANVSHEYAPGFVAQGMVAVDNSSVWHGDPEVPLVVSEISPRDATKHPKDIIVNPNCATIAAMPVLRPLVDKISDLEHLFVPSYQVVPGSGIRDVQELVSQTRSDASQNLAALALDGYATILSEPEAYVAPITLSVVPLIDLAVEDRGEEAGGEQKLCSESRRVLHIPDLRVSGACMCVPVFIGRTLTIRTEFFGAITADEAYEVLASAPDVRLIEVLTPLEAMGCDEVLCGHIRQDQTVKGNRGLMLVLSSDNLRRGAALNAIQVAEVAAKELLD